jgi:hypothetical protein
MKRLLWVAVVVLSLSSARTARAKSAVTGFIGASTGGDITVLTDPGFDLQTALKTSPIYGFRVGAYGFPIGLEGSLSYSPSSLTGGAFDDQLQAKTSMLYAEANVLIIILPGPVAPFVTGGGGLHSLDFNVADVLNFKRSQFGYNFGGGVMVNASKLALRFDVRDHVTTFGLDDFGLGIIGGIIGLDNADARIHNVEISFGLGIRF